MGPFHRASLVPTNRTRRSLLVQRSARHWLLQANGAITPANHMTTQFCPTNPFQSVVHREDLAEA